MRPGLGMRKIPIMQWYSRWYWRLIWAGIGFWAPALVADKVVWALNPATHSMEDIGIGLLALAAGVFFGLIGVAAAMLLSNPPALPERPDFLPDGSNWPTD